MNTANPNLITQRSVVQIHPPQPNSSSTYGRSTSSAHSISPKISPNPGRRQRSPATDTRKSVIACKVCSDRIIDVHVGPPMGFPAHQGSLRFRPRQPCLRVNSGVPEHSSGRHAVIHPAGNVDNPNRSPEKQIVALLTEGQSAQRLGVSLSTLRRWRKNGVGPKFFLLGGILRYRIVDLDEFVARHTRPEVA
jgi:hypothetical protein